MIYKDLVKNLVFTNDGNSVPKIIDTKMNEEDKNFCLFNTIGITERINDKVTAAEEIVRTMENKYGKCWQCLVIDENVNGGFKINNNFKRS